MVHYSHYPLHYPSHSPNWWWSKFIYVYFFIMYLYFNLYLYLSKIFHFMPTVRRTRWYWAPPLERTCWVFFFSVFVFFSNTVSLPFIWSIKSLNSSSPTIKLLAPRLSMWFDEVNIVSTKAQHVKLMKIASWRIYWNQPGPELFKWRLCANMKMVGWFGLGP